MTMRCQLLWTATVALTMATLAPAAPPMDSAHHHLDMNKGLSSEFGTDEEVRQLLDLKGLAAQRDLGNLKQQELQESVPAPTPAPNAAPTDATNKGATEEQPKKDEKVYEGKEEGKDHENKEMGETTRSEDEPGHHDSERHGEEDHVQLKRQQLSRPHSRYTPLDLALYVYKTGDEEGVSLAIQELIAEGLMTAEEALSYLREIRANLQYLSLQDEKEQEEEEREVSENILKPLIKKNSLPLPLTEMTLADPETMLTPEMDYDGLMERLRSQDEISTEYSLEEVIYQLAKILFKQAMHREGDIGSEKALQEVAALLEKEAARGAITPEVEKKVLDVMVNSLVDSITEREFPSAAGPMIGGPGFKLSNQSPFALGNSAMIGGSNFKPSSDLFQLSKSTTKREAPEEKKKKTPEEKH